VSTDDEESEDDTNDEATSVCTEDLVGRMHREGLTIYDDEEEFRGNDEVTRGEAARFVTEYARMLELDDDYLFCNFTDIQGFDSMLQPYILQACAYGLLK